MMQWRKEVTQIAPYIPGKSIESVKQEYQLDSVTRLASNENPLGPSPKAVEAMQAALQDVHLYPDSSVTALREKLADKYGLSANEIVLANGADNIISLVVKAYINEGDELLYSGPTFPAYRSACLLMGGKPVEVPLTEDYVYNLEGLAAAVTEKTKLIFICNPNNPTGTLLEEQALREFIETYAKQALIVLDEAYIEYVDPSYATGIDYYKEGFPLLTIRTFSKYYGLAGLRVGYVIGDEAFLDPILRLREPFANNRLSIVGAIEALDDLAHLETHGRMNEEGKAYLVEELEKLGWKTYPSSTNFLFTRIKGEVKDLYEALLSVGIIVRPCTAWGLDDFVRISIGSMEENKKLIQALKEISKH